MPEFLGDALLELRVNTNPLRRGMIEGERAVRGSMMRMESESARRMAGIGMGMSRMGQNLTRSVTFPILGIAGAAAKMSMDFSRSMEMIHTQAGKSQAEVDRMSVSVLRLAKTLKLGISPQELAAGLFHLESIGLHGKKALDALKVAAEGAAVGHANLEQTATALGSAWLVDIKGAGNLRDVMAMLNATVGAGNMRMQDLVDALGTGVLPAAKLAGLGIRDVMGALAVLTDEGYAASSASAQFATALHFLYNPTQKAEKALSSIHLSGAQLAADMHKPQGLLMTFQDLSKHLDELPGGRHGVKAEQLLGDIFPAGRGRVMLTLLNQMDRYGMKLKQISRGQSQFADDVHKTMEQPAVRVQQAWAGLQSELIKFGQEVLPPLLSAGTKIAKFAENALHSFSALPPGAQKAIITGGLIMAGIGPALRVLGIFTGGISKMWDLTLKLSGILGGKDIAKTLGSKMSMQVATMEVAEMIVRNMQGGPGGGGGGGGAPGEKTPGGAPPPPGKGRFGFPTGDVPETGPVNRFAGTGVRGAVRFGGGLVAGASALAAMSHAQSGIPNQLNAAAHGIDPTQVLHLVGLPAITDLLPKVKKRMNFTPSQIALLGMGLSPKELGPAQRLLSGRQAFGAFGQGGNVIPTTAVARGDAPWARPQALTKFQTDARNATQLLSMLTTHSAKDFKALAKQAASVNDIKFTFADTLASELLQGKKVGSKGIQNIINQIDKLPPNAKADASAAMIQMTQQLENKGAIATGTTKKLRQAIVREFAQMGDDVAAKASKMADDIQHGSKRSASSAARNFANYQASVGEAVASGVLSAGQGADLIRTALNNTLKAFGAKKLVPAITAVTAASIGANVKAASSRILGNVFGAAQGGLIQVGREGARGPDAIPLSVGGSTKADIVVGEGEKVAVFNHDQQKVMDKALLRDGYHGLAGMFGRVRTRHGYATGGIVTASTFGGPGDPGTGSTGYKGDSLYQHPDSWAELNMGTALGNLPYLTPLDFTYRGKTGRALKRDIGAGGAGIGGKVRAVDLWFQFAQALGLTGLGNVLINGPGGINISIGGSGSGGTWKDLHSPGVVGDGTMADIVRTVYGTMTGAANAYGKAHMPAPNIGVGGASSFAGRGNYKMYRWPVPAGAPFSPGRIDRGQDFETSPHGTFDAIGKMTIQSGATDFPGITGQLLEGPAAGKTVFHGHTYKSFVHPGQLVQAGQPLGLVGHQGASYDGGITHLELGFLTDTGQVAAAQNANHYAYTGQQMHDLLEHIKTFGFGGLVGHQHGNYVTNVAHRHHQGKKTPKPKKKHFKPLKTTGNPRADRQVSKLNWLLNHDVPRLQDLMDYTGQGDDQIVAAYQSAHPDLNTDTGIVTPSNGTAPYIDADYVKMRLGELDQLYTWQGGVRTDLKQALNKINPLLKELHHAAKLRQKAIDKIKKAIKDNLSMIESLRKKKERVDPNIVKLKKAINNARVASTVTEIRKQLDAAEAIETPLGKAGRGARAAKRTLVASLRQKLLRAEGGEKVSLASLKNELLDVEAKDKLSKADMTDQIRKLEDQNHDLGGDRTTIGTGGKLGVLGKQLKVIQDDATTVTGDRPTLVGPSGIGGALGDATLAMAPGSTLSLEIAALQPGALSKALADAKGTGTVDNSTLTGLLEQRNTDLGKAYQTLALQSAAFAGMPFGGSFAEGGIVPGPRGKPVMIEAHGGEEYMGVDGQRKKLQVIVQVLDGAVDPGKINVIAEDAAVRVVNRTSRSVRPLPGSRRI